MLACSDKKKDDDGTSPTATSPAGGETPAVGETPAAGETPSGDALSDLDTLAGEFANREAKVAYTYTAEFNGEAMEGSFTLFSKPPALRRFDIISPDSGSTSFITNNDGSYLCSGDGAEGQCLVSPIGGIMPVPFLSYFSDPTGLSNLVDTTFANVDVDRSSETIAGQDASCFTTSAGATGEYCFTDDGLLLRVSATVAGAGVFTLEATSVEGAVADADFALPYDVMEIPGQ